MRVQHSRSIRGTLAIADALGVPRQTARNWLASWWAQRTPGVALEPSRGRSGWRWVLTRAFVARWKRGHVPRPQSGALAPRRITDPAVIVRELLAA